MSQHEAGTPTTSGRATRAGAKAPSPRVAAERSVTVKKTPVRTSRATKAKAASPGASAPTTTKAPARSTGRAAAKRTPEEARAAVDVSGLLKVKEDESPWTAPEIDDIAGVLRAEQERLVAELSGIQAGMRQLMSAGGDGSGDDDADTGVKTSNREQEFTVAQNSRRLLDEVELALAALADGTYGTCESCSDPIGKLRLQARPRTTLCMVCKQHQERH